jgi:hypothetical protein
LVGGAAAEPVSSATSPSACSSSTGCPLRFDAGELDSCFVTSCEALTATAAFLRAGAGVLRGFLDICVLLRAVGASSPRMERVRAIREARGEEESGGAWEEFG